MFLQNQSKERRRETTGVRIILKGQNLMRKLQKWIVVGIDDKSAKHARETYIPSYKGRRILLQVPDLDESLFLRFQNQT